MVALALPALGMKTANGNTDTLPQNLDVVQTFNRIQDAFPSENSGATVVVEAENVAAAPIVAAIRQLEAETGQNTELFKGAFTTEVSLT